MSASQILGPALGESIRELVPQWLLPVFIAITHLGSAGVFLTVFTLDYWFADHRRGAHALSLAFGGIALVIALKAFFAEPRPAQDIRVIAVTGYSFPSGHATGATIGFGILAYDLKIRSFDLRAVVAAIMILLVALSRVVLGVHFVRDVLAGVVVGLVFLIVAITLTKHAPRPGFWLAAVISLLAFAISGASHDGTAIFGVTVGAVLAWEAFDTIPTLEEWDRRFALVVIALPVIGGLGYLGAYVLESLLLVFFLSSSLTIVLIGAPLLVERFAPTIDRVSADL